VAKGWEDVSVGSGGRFGGRDEGCPTCFPECLKPDSRPGKSGGCGHPGRKEGKEGVSWGER
jgi:hypothetical protein